MHFYKFAHFSHKDRTESEDEEEEIQVSFHMYNTRFEQHASLDLYQFDLF